MTDGDFPAPAPQVGPPDTPVRDLPVVAVDPGKQSSSIPAEAAAQNARYAERAAVALHAHTDLTQAGDRAPVAEAIIRLLTDLTHLADAYGVDFGHARDCAEDEHSDEMFGG